jgi:hypothetical protein
MTSCEAIIIIITISQYATICTFTYYTTAGNHCPGQIVATCDADVIEQMTSCEAKFIDSGECGEDCFACFDEASGATMCTHDVAAECAYDGDFIKPNTCPGT